MSEGDELLRELEELRGELYSMVRAESPDGLAVRPAPEVWSVVENLRHLLYAEQRHVARVYVEGFSYSPMGLHTDGAPKRSGVGTEPTDDVEAVLSAWDEVHAGVRAALGRVDDPRAALDRNVRHLKQHVRAIRRLLDTDGRS